MPAPDLDLEQLLAPLGAEAPCGPDLAYGDEFAALERAAAGKPETQWSAAVAPDWADVHARAMELACRWRDLRTAVWITRAGMRLFGIRGLANGLALVDGLVQRHWANVHPQPEPAEPTDTMMRMNTIAALAAREAGIADLRASPLLPVRGGLSLHELDLGLGRAEPGASESVPTEQGVLDALRQLMQQHPDLVPATREALQSATALDSRLQSLGTASCPAPDLAPLHAALQMLDSVLRRLAPDTGAGGAAPEKPSGSPLAAATPEGIRSRDDAARELTRVCEWIEANEPSNPAPLLIRRAQRLMSKSFLDIVRDLAPDGVSQVERIAGIES